jgi:hypothetical protein
MLQPPQTGHGVGDVDLELVLEALLLARIHHREGHRDRVFLHQPLDLGQRKEGAVDPQHGMAADLEMEIGGFPFDRDLEQIVDVHSLPPSTAPFIRPAPPQRAQV